MHLFDLVDSAALILGASGSGPWARAPDAGVPAWTLGCFRRRCISYFTGEEDTQTEVIWLQSRGLTADFRRQPAAPRVPGPAALAELPLPELLALAQVEGGLARTRWDGRWMHWEDWVSFQTHPKWPEPGRLERVGNSLVEFAPSGAYVEDWRFQPPGTGPLIGLSLLDERDVRAGQLLHRGGGLIVCGRHAAFVRGRPEPLPEPARLVEHVRACAGDAAALDRVFSFEASYATAPDATTPDATTPAGPGPFTVSHSTLPWREGEPLLSLEGFSHSAESGLVLQHIDEGSRRIERRFRADTLEREFSGGAATSASPAAVEWLQRERDALLATSR